MKTPAKVNNLELVDTCVSYKIDQWNRYMKGTTKANGRQIRMLIKEHLPELYDALILNYRNPYEWHSRKKKNLLVYVHSGIEYFLSYN